MDKKVDDSLDKPISPWWIGIAGLIALVTLGLYVNQFFGNFSDEHERWGTAGDYFGGVMNPIVSLFTLWLLFKTYHQQRTEFSKTRDEMSKQEIQLQFQVEELRLQTLNQKQELKVQKSIHKLQQFENTFFQMLNNFSEYISNIRTEENSGRKCLEEYYSTFQRQWRILSDETRGHLSGEFLTRQGILKKIDSEIERVEQFYLWFYWPSENYPSALASHHTVLGPYFRMLYHLSKFVDQSDLEENDKQFYLKILRAQLSSHELLIIFYNCCTSLGKDLKPLVEKYSFLKHIPITLLLKKSTFKDAVEHIDFWEVEAFTPKDEQIPC